MLVGFALQRTGILFQEDLQNSNFYFFQLNIINSNAMKLLPLQTYINLSAMLPFWKESTYKSSETSVGQGHHLRRLHWRKIFHVLRDWGQGTPTPELPWYWTASMLRVDSYSRDVAAGVPIGQAHNLRKGCWGFVFWRGFWFAICLFGFGLFMHIGTRHGLTQEIQWSDQNIDVLLLFPKHHYKIPWPRYWDGFKT